MVKIARDGMTLIAFGSKAMVPTVATVGVGDAGSVSEEADHPRGGDAGILAHRHRRGAGMVGHAVDGYALPGNALQVLDRADGDALALQHRPLFDMQLDIDMRLEEAGLMSAGITDALQLLTQHRAVGADRGQRLFDVPAAGKDQRAHHIRRIAHALLIGEGGDNKRARRRKSCLLQGLDCFEAGKHAVAAVIDAGVDHRVDVRAEHHRFLACLGVALPDAEDVAHAIDGDVEPCLFQPTDKAVAAKLVHVGGGDADEPALRIATEAAELLDTAKQTVGIDRQIAHAGCLASATSSGAIPTSSA